MNEPIRAHTLPCSMFLAAEEDSITINVDCFIAIKLTDSVSKAVKRGCEANGDSAHVDKNGLQRTQFALVRFRFFRPPLA